MLNYFRYSQLLLDLQKNPAFLIIIVAIFGSLLAPVLSINFASATSDEEGGDTGDGDNGGGHEPEPEPEPDPNLNLGLAPSPEPPGDPCVENPEAEGCTPQPPVDPCVENPTAEGCEPTLSECNCPRGQPCPQIACVPPANLVTPPPRVPECPEGFNMNEDGQCYPDKPCPPGYARAENDESGACLPLPSIPPPPSQPMPSLSPSN